METLQNGFFSPFTTHSFNPDALLIPTCQWINNTTEDNVARKRTIADTKNELQHHHQLSIIKK